jgi:DNA-binding FadR family transcriptional regulator
LTLCGQRPGSIGQAQALLVAMSQESGERAMLGSNSPAAGETPRLATVEDVIQLVRDWITSAKLREGDRLPTERALAEQFMINRNQVRRAFLELDRLGLINRHVGRGTFVGTAPRREPQAPSAGRADLAPDDYSPAAILQTRTMIEPRIAQLAVATATLADVKALEGLVAEMAEAASDEQLDRLAIVFFENIATATHNPLIAALARQVGTARRAVARTGDQLSVSGEHEAIVAEFRAVAAAVQARDATAAAAAVRVVLIRASRSFGLLARMELLPEVD